MKEKPTSSNLGAVVSVRGSVVDVRFDAYLPPIYTLLRAQDGKIAIEVLAQLDAHCVRGIAPTPSQGLVRGSAVEDTGGPLKAPVGKGILSRMFDVFGNAIDRQPAPEDVQWRIREYLFISLFRACAESLASENASRLAAMQRAEKNIDELLEDLNRTFHRQRQSSIDEELFDVVSGFEALSAEEK
jgi:vacuolar-type H+-ATPase subunit B/Vma2